MRSGSASQTDSNMSAKFQSTVTPRSPDVQCREPRAVVAFRRVGVTRVAYARSRGDASTRWSAADPAPGRVPRGWAAAVGRARPGRAALLARRRPAPAAPSPPGAAPVSLGARQRAGRGARAARRGRRRDARRAHQAARDDVVAPGRDRVPGRQARPAVDADLRATALREAHEEIGLDPGAVEIVARLDGIATVASRFTITPFVGFLAPGPRSRRARPRSCGSSRSPLSELLDPDVYREERWDGFQRDMSVHFYELADETVWGATARILTDLLTRLVTAGESRIRLQP